MIKIAKILKAPNATQEDFELEFSAEKFDVPEIKGSVLARGKFMRVEEGIIMLLQDLAATQVSSCSRCGRKLKLPLIFKPSEWLFYEKNPVEGDDENEHLRLDPHRFELDPREPIRQDLILNLEQNPHCKKACKPFPGYPSEEGIKALANLKDLINPRRRNSRS